MIRDNVTRVDHLPKNEGKPILAYINIAILAMLEIAFTIEGLERSNKTIERN